MMSRSMSVRAPGLPGAVLESLSRAGHLQAIYMVVASLSNFRGLIERKQRHG